MAWLLGQDVIDGPLPWTIWGLTLALVVVLAIRRPGGGWLVRLTLGVLIGALVGFALALTVIATKMLGDTLPLEIVWWVGGAFAVIGVGVVSLWRSRVWRKIVAVLLILLALVSAALGVNRAFGIDRTLGAMLGISTVEAIDDLASPHPSASATGPLYRTWKPPADMPAKGKVGLLTGANAIPSTAGFAPRDASIYLPPAAQVAGAPALPLVVMMMGFPGNPDPSFIQTAMDSLAAEHQGLAPIVVVVDQLGDPSQDPACADSKAYGGVATYVNRDVVAYAKSRLNIIDDPRYWTIAGYSNGGACAFTYASAHPEIWGNLVSISGDEFPGVEIPDEVLRTVFGGDKAAFEANKPASLLQRNASRFAGHVAVFTVGGNDPGFIPGAERNAALAKAAGFTTTFYTVPGAGHVADALNGGLPAAFGVLYPVLGLSPN